MNAEPQRQKRADSSITRIINATVDERYWKILAWKKSTTGIPYYRLIEDALEKTYGEEYRSAHGGRLPPVDE